MRIDFAQMQGYIHKAIHDYIISGENDMCRSLQLGTCGITNGGIDNLSIVSRNAVIKYLEESQKIIDAKTKNSSE